jgi:preprotein translocase subunit YajC
MCCYNRRPYHSVTGSAMSHESLQRGDWVRANSGTVGRITHVSRLSAFVYVRRNGSTYIASIQLSELTKIDGPQRNDDREYIAFDN